MNILLALMRKDWRTYRGPVLGTLVLGLLPYANLLVIHLATRHADAPPGRQEWLATIARMSICSMALLAAAAAAAAFGGTAWAAERSNGLATFMALLPPTPLRAAASKLAATAVWLACCFAFDIAVGVVAVAAAGVTPYSSESPVDFLVIAGRLACYAVAVFGVAWCCSTWLNSSTISAVTGIIAGLVLAFVVAGLPPEHRQAGWVASALILGTLALAAGTAHQLRRVAP